jgi:hypothetical protein
MKNIEITPTVGIDDIGIKLHPTKTMIRSKSKLSKKVVSSRDMLREVLGKDAITENLYVKDMINYFANQLYFI